MDYKISYQKKFNDGYCYSQTINATMTRAELQQVNSILRKAADLMPYIRLLRVGVNYTTLTTQAAFVKYFGIQYAKRYIKDRNTIIKITRQ
jgi:hypothetical protein